MKYSQIFTKIQFINFYILVILRIYQYIYGYVGYRKREVKRKHNNINIKSIKGLIFIMYENTYFIFNTNFKLWLFGLISRLYYNSCSINVYYDIIYIKLNT